MRYLLVLILLKFSFSFGQEVPEEAQRHYYRGQAAMEMAKVPADYESVIAEYTQAINLAPDWPAPRYALGQVYEKIENFTEAISNFKYYLELAPDAFNSEEVKATIYKLEYKLEKNLEKQKVIDGLINFKLNVISGEVKWFPCGAINKFMQTNNELQVFISCTSHPDNEQTVSVKFDGAKLSFKFLTYNCPTATELRQYPCAWEVNIDAELISKSPIRFKVKETNIPQFDGGVQSLHYSEWQFGQ